MIEIKKIHVAFIGAILFFFSLGTAFAYPLWPSFVGGAILLGASLWFIIIGSSNRVKYPLMTVDQLVVGVVVMAIGIAIVLTFGALYEELGRPTGREGFVHVMLSVIGFIVMVGGAYIGYSTARAHTQVKGSRNEPL